MSTDCLKVSIADNIATVTIDRPPVNALDQTAMAEFTGVFGKLWDLNDVRVVILTNTGKIFCGGMDLKSFGGTAPRPGEAAEYFAIHRGFQNAIREFPKPLIAAVNGPAIGTGFSLAGGCDIMLASENAYFAMPEVVAGQPSGAAFMTRMFGQSKARRLFFTGDRIDAHEMYRLGLIEACVPSDQLMPEALKIARKIAKNDPAVMRATKQTCIIAAEVPYPVSKSLEYLVLGQSSQGEASQQAVRDLLASRSSKSR
jgi:enoyl-CoA hydratase